MFELFLEYVWEISLVVATGLLVAYGWGCAWKIFVVGKEINRMLGRLNSAEDFNVIDAEFKNSKRLAFVWENFRDTLTQTRDGIFLSTDAADFFSPQNFTRGMNMSFWHAYGGIFTGLGILGTFISLTIGLQGLDMTSGDIEALKKGIAKLLSTVDSAFVTSLVGIGAGLLYSVFHHWLMKKFQSTVQKLATALDKKFPCKTAETWLADNLQETRDQTATLLDSESWLAKSYPELQNQTVSLQNIGETVTEAIHNGLDEKFGELDKKLVGVGNELGKLNGKFDGLDNKLGELNGKLDGLNKNIDKKLDNVADKICAAIGQLGNEGSDKINNTLNKVAGAQMDRFAAALDRFSDIIDKKLQDADKLSKLMNEQLLATLEEFANIMAQIATNANKNSDDANKKLSLTLEELRNFFKLITENSADEREKSVQKFLSTVDGLTKALNAFMEKFKAQQDISEGKFESLVNKLLADLKDFTEQQKKFLDIATTANTNQISEAVKAFREIVDTHNQTTQDVFMRIQKLLAETEKFLSRVNDAGNSLTQAATPLKQSSDLLKMQLVTTTRAAENFRNEITAQMKNLTNENQITRENLSALTGQLATFVKNFNGIADELERSTKIISDSLENYNGKINDGLRDVLTKFDKSMTAAVGYLQSLTEGLIDAIENLKKLRNGR